MKHPGKALARVMLAVAVCAAGACAPPQQPKPQAQPQSRETAAPVADDVLIDRVRTALNTGGLDATEIDVTAAKGVVRLSGYARDQQTIERAETAARRVPGVTGVINQLQLRGGNPERRR